MDAPVGWRSLPDRQSGTPFPRGPDRPRHKPAAAVRANIMQFVLDAVCTKRAFIAADARVRRMRRKILVAIFAIRSELQRHGVLVTSGVGSSQITREFRMTNFPRFQP